MENKWRDTWREGAGLVFTVITLILLSYYALQDHYCNAADLIMLLLKRSASLFSLFSGFVFECLYCFNLLGFFLPYMVNKPHFYSMVLFVLRRLFFFGRVDFLFAFE